MRIALVSSEVVGFAKTGGLADVAGSLPLALRELGHEVVVVMPLYRAVRQSVHALELCPEKVLSINIGSSIWACRLYRSHLPASTIPIYFIDAPHYFDRDDPQKQRGLYQQMMPNGYKADYPDNAERFIFFSKAILETLSTLDFIPDVIHANDWQTGLVPVYLREKYHPRPEWQRTRSLFTIHNIAYQGMFGADLMAITGLPGWLFNADQLEYHGHLNCLKAGIIFSDAVNTVSPTYAREIQTSEFGCGLEGVLTHHQHKLSGIVNGVNYQLWNPEHDPHLVSKYHVESVAQNKLPNKLALQKQFNLPQNPDAPLFGLIARLAYQKGIDLVLQVAHGLLDLGAQLVLLGEGDPEYHDQLQALQARHAQAVGLYLGFNETLAHQIEAGADFFLMPSRYEPSGLNQLYSLRYGTPPIVRATGGLADTVVNATEENIQSQQATGFSFYDYHPSALYETCRWAIHLYRHRRSDFEKIVRQGMLQDWSWTRSAREYEALYQKIWQQDMPTA